MKFIRLTSVFLCCALLSFFMSVSVSAVVDDDNYYSLAPVSSSHPVLVDNYSVKPFEFTNSDSTVLEGIYRFVQYLTVSPSSFQSGSIMGMLDRIGSLVFQISQNLGGFDGVAQETTLSSFENLFSSFAPVNHEWPGDSVSFGSYLSTMFALTTNNDRNSGDFNSNFDMGFAYNVWVNPVEDSISPIVSSQFSWSGFVSTLLGNFIYDGMKPTGSGGGPTIYRMLHLLQDTLASEDDRKLVQNQKGNREQIEKDFLTGQSGKTSLGKDDFGSLSSVGGTFNDISSLNGQASLDSFSSGLADADSTGQGWFSQSTKDALDSVSGSTNSKPSVSTFSNDGLYSVDVDPDPYNMGNFEENYSWLWGEK